MSNIVNLRKGQRVELAKGVSKLRVELTWQASRKAETWDLDIMALELNSEQLIANNDIRYLVFYNNLKDPQGALVHSGDDRTGEGDGEEMRLDVAVLKIFSIYRSGSIWKVKAINEGVTSSLSRVLKNYGLDSNDNTI